jgi:hypothetical protein
METIMRIKVGLVLGLLLAVALAGCGKADGNEDGVASAGGTAAGATAQPSVDRAEMAKKFAACMKEQGVDVQMGSAEKGEGDPVRVSPGAGGEQDPKKVEAAMEKCKQYAPSGGDPSKVDPAQLEAQRKLAKCLRENGLPDFPDPDADGKISAQQGSGIDPHSDAFKAAQQKCQQLMGTPSPRATG